MNHLVCGKCGTIYDLEKMKKLGERHLPGDRNGVFYGVDQSTPEFIDKVSRYYCPLCQIGHLGGTYLPKTTLITKKIDSSPELKDLLKEVKELIETNKQEMLQDVIDFMIARENFKKESQ